MQKLEQITASPDAAIKLVSLNIEPRAFIWHETQMLASEGLGEPIKPVWEAAIFKNPVFSKFLVPAWTKEELDVMIGNDMEKPDIWARNQISRATNPLTYPVFFPDKAQIFTSGAEASAQVLIFLIENRLVQASDANTRYKKIFKL